MKTKLRNFFKKLKFKFDEKIKPKLVIALNFLYKYTGLKWVMKKYNNLSAKNKTKITGVLFVLPWFIGLYIFGLRPFTSSLRMSFAKQAQYVINNQTMKAEFVLKGWTIDHFVNLFKNHPSHLEAVISLITDVALVVPLVLVFSLLLALMLNQQIKGKGVFRVIFFIPVILLSGNLLSYFNQYNLLSIPAIQSTNIIRQINRFLPPQFTNLIINAFDRIVLILWLSGVQTLIFLAGLQKRNKAIYEAASIDGASMWDSFWKITLPSLHSLMIINIIYTVVIYANLSNNALTVLINQTLTDVRFGRAYSSMLAWILFLVELLIIGFYTLIVKLSNRRYV